ncbi:MAG: hypothetical protein C0403_04400 [Desulfobacterium sp.]|nr:hypothetical protein [Desulfobacterium sp.]
MKTFLSKIYIIGFMVLTLGFMALIWKVTFHQIIVEYQNRKKSEQITDMRKEKERLSADPTFQSAIMEGEERVKHYLGYRVLEDTRIEGHFHHIDFNVIPDKGSYCITCHGDIPHDKSKELRAFANMHASFIACQTCHIRLEGEKRTGVFKWYARGTGEITDSPVKEGVLPGRYQAKIIPFENENGRLQRMDNPERMLFAAEFKKKEPELSELQKTKARKIIHNIVSKQPHICEDCHQQQAPILPFKELGYPEKRVNAFISTEVIGMIKNYTKFYMPRMLHPGQADDGSTPSGDK